MNNKIVTSTGIINGFIKDQYGGRGKQFNENGIPAFYGGMTPPDKEYIYKLYLNAVNSIQYARDLAVKQVNFIQLMTYYSIRRWIVEKQLESSARTKYGHQVIKNLSKKLLNEFGRGFFGDTLKNARKYYLIYKEPISETVFSLLNEDNFYIDWMLVYKCGHEKSNNL